MNRPNIADLIADIPYTYPVIRFSASDLDLLQSGSHESASFSYPQWVVDLGDRDYLLTRHRPSSLNLPLKRFAPKYEKILLQGYRIIDGDSCDYLYSRGAHTFSMRKGRLFKVDTPESNTEAGQLVTQVKHQWHDLRQSELQVTIGKGDGSGVYGRTILVPHTDRRDNLSDYLLQNQLGRYYDGTKRRPPWSEDDLQAIAERAQRILY